MGLSENLFGCPFELGIWHRHGTGIVFLPVIGHPLKIAGM